MTDDDAANRCTCRYMPESAPSVRKGYELGGYVIEKCEFCRSRRAEAAERERDELREALEHIATECSTFPIKEGLAFRCESIARAALEDKP